MPVSGNIDKFIMLKNPLLIIALSLCTAFYSFGQQKFGHMNSGNMLELMPEVQATDKALAALHDSLEVELDTMMTKFRSNYDNALKAVNEGTMTKIRQSQVEQELQAEQAKIAEFQKQAQLVVNQRRQILLAPVIDRLNTAIVEVGKEKGYSFIFDVSAGSMLYVNETEDVSALVAAKLGLKLEDKK